MKRVKWIIFILLLMVVGVFDINDVYAKQVVSNVVVFVRFNGDLRDVFNAKTSSSSNWTLIKNMYDKNEGQGSDNSFKNYIKTISEGNIEVNNYFPQESDDLKSVNTYTLDNSIEYYQNSDMIVSEVISSINNSKIKYNLSSEKLDNLNSSFLDNLTIIVQGSSSDSNAIISHKTEYGHDGKIGGLTVSNYNIIPSSSLVTDDASIGAKQAQNLIAHEFLHVLGFQDLYRKTDSGEPVGMWDIMSKSSFYLQYPLSYLRAKHGWVDIKEITKSGTYTLTAVSESGENKVFEIKTPLSSSESIILEYRKKNTSNYFAFEHGIPSSGLLMYRVDNKVEDYTNIRGKNYIYVYRPNVTDKDSGLDLITDGEYKGVNGYYDAALEPEKGETEYGSTDLTKTFKDNTLYYSDGQNSGVKISNAKLSNDKNKITFNVDFADYKDSDFWKTIGTLDDGSYGDSILYRNKDTNKMYVAYTSGIDVNNKIIVKEWDGTVWKLVGNEVLGSSSPSISIYKNDMYLVCLDSKTNHPTLYKLVNNSWEKIVEYQVSYPQSMKLIESDNTLYFMYEEVISGSSTKLIIKDAINDVVIAKKNANNFGNPDLCFYNNKLYLAYSSYFDTENNNAVIESFDLSKKVWKSELISDIKGSNIHYIKKYNNKMYVFIGTTGTTPSVYTYDGSTWVEDKISKMNNYLNSSINIINDNVYISYINVDDNKSYLLKLHDHNIEVVDDNLGKDYSYLYTDNDKENMYALTITKNSSSIDIKTKQIEKEKENTKDDVSKDPDSEDKNDDSVIYTTHVQTYGWQDEKKDGEMAGTSGEYKRLEGIKIRLDTNIQGDVEYVTYVQTYGWQSWKSNGEMAGTSGEYKRLEAIKIRLTGELANKYDIYYRVHSQTYGWLGWAKNGETSGTIDQAKRLEAIEIKLVPKGTGEVTGKSYNGPEPVIKYTSHVQSYGWQDMVSNGELSGTTGLSKRIEAIYLQLGNSKYMGGINYQTYIEGLGWEKDEKHSSEISGTTGQSRSIEAIKINLTDELSQNYDIYYRVHSKTFGWLGWAKNGEVAGTTGYDFRIEAIEVKLVPKGTGEATGDSYRYKETNLKYQAHVQSIGDQNFVNEGEVSGTVGMNKRLEALKISVDSTLQGNVIYKSYSSDNQWTSDWITDNSFTGTTGQFKSLYLIAINLTGEIANKYDIYYRVHSEKYGWLGWAKNGETAGVTYYDIQAIEVKLYLKQDSTKNSLNTSNHYIESGFYYENGHTYYKDKNGNNARDWITIMNTKYFFNSLGVMVGKNVKKIIDVSAYQGNVDWDKVAREGDIDGVILRISAGCEVEDSFFSTNIKALKRLNIPYGIYIYSNAENKDEGRLYAEFTSKMIKDYSLNPRIGIFLDLEQNNITSYMNLSHYTQVVEGYMEVMYNNGYGNLTRIYTYKNMADNQLNSDYIRNQITWIAQYNHFCTYSGSYVGWQYSDNERIPGINGAVDASAWFANF